MKRDWHRPCEKFDAGVWQDRLEEAVRRTFV